MTQTMTRHKEQVAQSFSRFNRLPTAEKLAQLISRGLLIDTDLDGDKIIKLYFLDGFFVEKIETLSQEHVELIPYRSGYRISYDFLN